MSKPIRINFRDDGNVFETFLLEDRHDIGPDLRQADAPLCEAGSSVPLDVPFEHCQACEMSIADQIGLTDSEMDRISRWREVKNMRPDDIREERMTGADLGAILDKIVAKLDTYSTTCDAKTHRIVVEVEPTP